MAAQLDTPNESSHDPARQAAPTYTIVTQVKSSRVVYFTEDADYAPPMDGDWYYVSTYQGALPEGMSLRNCWGWRFNGGVFSDAREPARKPRKETLLEHNRRALLRILQEKIDAIRAPYAPTCAMGELARAAKLAEARAYLERPESMPAYPMLGSAAVARHITLREAAQLICKKAEQTEQILLATERVRESLARAITHAGSEDALLQLRAGLLDQVYPELTQQFRFHVDNTEPPKPDEPVPDAHRHHEIARLQVQLREKINQKRASIDSQYIRNDEALKYKAKLAQLLTANQGDKPVGVDFTVLETYAEARGFPLMEAAGLLLDSLAEAGRILAETEQIKDRMLARIDSIKTLRDIERVSAELEGL